MKKIVALFLCLCCLFSVFSVCTYAEDTTSETTDELDNPDETFIVGDVDRDDIVSIVDVTSMQRFICNLPVADIYFAILVSDVDRDEALSIMDCTWIQRWLVHLPAPECVIVGQKFPVNNYGKQSDVKNFDFQQNIEFKSRINILGTSFDDFLSYIAKPKSSRLSYYTGTSMEDDYSIDTPDGIVIRDFLDYFSFTGVVQVDYNRACPVRGRCIYPIYLSTDYEFSDTDLAEQRFMSIDVALQYSSDYNVFMSDEYVTKLLNANYYFADKNNFALDYNGVTNVSEIPDYKAFIEKSSPVNLSSSDFDFYSSHDAHLWGEFDSEFVNGYHYTGSRDESGSTKNVAADFNWSVTTNIDKVSSFSITHSYEVSNKRSDSVLIQNCTVSAYMIKTVDALSRFEDVENASEYEFPILASGKDSFIMDSLHIDLSFFVES